MTTYPSRTVFGAFGERMFLTWGRYSSVVLRIALGVGFLSAVADRFGWWGPFGEPNVDWGNFSRFLEYTQAINSFVPAEWIPALGIIATGAEILLGLLLLVGWHTRAAALLSALLLLTFGVAMIIGLGVKAPLNYAVFTGMGGSLLLANCQSFPFSLDQLRSHRTDLAENG
ncbi:MAG: putative oxidoreductase [Acidobacteriota bacterium]